LLVADRPAGLVFPDALGNPPGDLKLIVGKLPLV
jgi:hypothetical protein